MNRVGEVVLYHTTTEERDVMEATMNVQDVLPAIVVADWGSGSLNLKVMMDGNGQDLWKTSAQEVGYATNEDLDLVTEGCWEDIKDIPSFKFKKGEMVKAKNPGFRGTITGRADYHNVENQYKVTAISSDPSKAPKVIWYYEREIEDWDNKPSEDWRDNLVKD